MSSTLLFSQAEVDAFLDRIDAPEQTRDILKSLKGGDDALRALTTLQQRTMVSVPFENTSLHYATWQPFELDAKPLYRKVVERREGGACFQVTRLFMHMIRSMGFQCYPIYGRINVNISAAAAPGAKGSVFGEYVHMLLIVTIDETRYLVDPCFGPNEPNSPVPLREDFVQADTPGRERRLIWSNIAQNTDADQRYWIMQFRPAGRGGNPPGKWMDAYCFRADECLLSDFDTVHMSCRFGRRSWFMNKVMAFRWLADEDGVPAGWTLMWENVVRKNWKGRVSIVETLTCDQDRVVALDRYFDVKLDPENVSQIAGTISQLRAMPPKKTEKPKEKSWLHQDVISPKL